jgi:hypothetical protein
VQSPEPFSGRLEITLSCRRGPAPAASSEKALSDQMRSGRDEPGHDNADNYFK